MTIRQVRVGSLGPFLYDDAVYPHAISADGEIVDPGTVVERTWPVGAVYMTTTATNPSIELDYGTWSNLGSLTIGTTTVYAWKRTA